MSRPSPQAAFVLHHWPWSETSLILDLFTREQGRVTVVAKGAKRPYSQLRSVLLPFQRLTVLLSRTKADAGRTWQEGDTGEIVTLRTAEFAGGMPMLPAGRLFAGFYLNELLMKLLARQDAHPRLFDAYAQSLAALSADSGVGDEPVLRAFELWLLRETGVLPELDRLTATQEPVQPERGYALHPEGGVVVPALDQPRLAGQHCVTLHEALQANDTAALQVAATTCLPALKVQLRGLLHYHLGSSQLRTRQAMIELRRLLGSEVDTFTRHSE